MVRSGSGGDRSSRPGAGRGSVEFLGEPDDEAPGGYRRPPVRGVLAAGAIAGVIVLVVLNGPPSTTPQPRPTRPRPVDTCAARGCAAAGAPTAAMSALFRRVLPGSVVVGEHSVASRAAGPALARRTVEVVSGNVVIDVVVRPASGRAKPRRGTVDVERGAYLIEYRFRGYYPPTRAQLDQLSADPRLISPRA